MIDYSIIYELKKALQEEHARLVAQLKEIARPDPQMKGDWDAAYPQFEPAETGSHGSREIEEDEVEEYEVQLEAEHTLESRLLAITNALERIQKETYGACVKCGKELSLEQLKANPAAEYHTEHTA